MTPNDGCSRRRRAVHVLATIRLGGCATVSSDMRAVSTCPSAVDYSWEFQARADDELALLPHGSAIGEMLADYAVMRDQVRACNLP